MTDKIRKHDAISIKAAPGTCCPEMDLRIVQWDWRLICFSCGKRHRPQDIRKRQERLGA